MIWYDMIYLTAIGLTPGGSSTVQYSTHLHTNNTQNNTIDTNNTQNNTIDTNNTQNNTIDTNNTQSNTVH